jgi:ABC-type lipoprotein release transport system permease subunit
VLVAMGDRSASVQLCGIDPQREARITNWRDRLMAGSWFEAENQVVIGRKLAEKLELEVGGKMVLTTANLIDGELSSKLVHVGGILWTQNPELDRQTVVTHLSLARELTGLQDGVHEIVLKLDGELADRAVLDRKLEPLRGEGVEVVPWQDLMPALLDGLEMQDQFMGLTFAVLFLLSALGIANTMGMSLLERTREFGMLQAVGTPSRALGTMVVSEYACMGLLGGWFGYLLGMLATWYFAANGISFNDLEMAGLVLNEPLFPEVDGPRMLRYTLIFCLLVPFLSWLPIRRVLKRDPVEALRFE